MKLGTLFLITCLTATSSHTNSGIDAQKKQIEFNEESKTLLDWINVVKKNPEHPFCTTKVFLWNGCEFVQIGAKGFRWMCFTYENENIFDHIKFGNFVYRNAFAREKNKWSQGEYQDVGAIFLGTTNEDLANQHFLKTFKLTGNKEC
ncbi:hypothetical protein HOD08_04045 [bacterium]|nr:hypothetical protein [bacterium]